MSVKVIDTLKPKNEGAFPIAEAADIAVTAEKRLPEALADKADASALAETNATVAGKANTSDVTAATNNLQSQINELITPVTQDAEVQNARVSENGTSYETLKSRLDAEYDVNKSGLDNIENVVYNRSEKNYYGNILNYDLDPEHEGYYKPSETKKIVRYKVEPGDVLYITEALGMQLQSTATIYAYSDGVPSNIVTTYGAYEGILKIPEGVYCVTINYNINDSINTVYILASKIEGIQSETDQTKSDITELKNISYEQTEIAYYKVGSYELDPDHEGYYKPSSSKKVVRYKVEPNQILNVTADLGMQLQSTATIYTYNDGEPSNFVATYETFTGILTVPTGVTCIAINYNSSDEIAPVYKLTSINEMCSKTLYGEKVEFEVTTTQGFIRDTGEVVVNAGNYYRDTFEVMAGYEIFINSACWSDTSAIAFSIDGQTWVSLANGTPAEAQNDYSAVVDQNGYVSCSYNSTQPHTIKVNKIGSSVEYRLGQLEESRSKRHSLMKSFGDQPAANGTETSFCDVQQDYNTLLTDVYEPLRATYPNYISREIIGRDASNTYDIYAYTFEPRYYQQHILLVAGIHANEEDAIACLARILQLIANSDGTNEDLEYIRQNVKISVIPVVNVWGFSQSPKVRTNADNQSIQGFDEETPIAEDQAVMNFINTIKSELSFVTDMHTTTNDSYRDFYGVIHKHCPNVRSLFRVNSWLCDHYAQDGRTVDDQYFGYRPSTSTLNYYCWGTLGLPSATLELSDYHWDVTKSTSTVITMGVTMWLNYIIQQINDNYKPMADDIPESDYREVKG